MRTTHHVARGALLRAAAVIALLGATLALSACPQSGGAQSSGTQGGSAQRDGASDIAVERPWARAAVQGGNGGAFMRLENRGGQADRLVSAASPAARRVELHSTVRDGDIMRMRAVNTIEVPARGAVQPQPGGLHVMLIGLERPLRQGEQLPLTLTFERAGPVAVDLAVQAAGAAGTAGHGGAMGGGAAPQR